MNARRYLSVHVILLLTCLLPFVPSTAAHGDGSILFTPDLTTSPAHLGPKLQDDDADIFGTSNEITVCVWVYADGSGQDGFGSILRLDEGGSKIILGHENTPANTLSWHSFPGKWTFPADDDKWNAISLTYNKNQPGPTFTAPVVHVNFVQVAVTPVTNPSGNPTVETGYCVGNDSVKQRDWDGKIVHLQAHNRSLDLAEREACLRLPGSVAKDLRLWLPMTNGIDIHDRSGRDNHAVGEKLLTGSDGPLLVRPLGATARGVALLNSGYTKIDQHVIPRFGDGSTHPAARLVGQGAGSVVQGTTYGPESGTVDPQEIVVTEDYTKLVKYWTTDTHTGTNVVPAVLQAEVKDLTIAGKDSSSAGGYGQDSKVNTNPYLSPASTHRDLELGLYVQSAGALVEKVRFFHIAGTCCHIKGPYRLEGLGATYQPFDREKTTIRDIWCLRAYRGIEITQVDTVVGNIVCRALRDWGVRFGAGATQIEGPVHLFGITAAPAFNAGVTPAPAAWFDTTAADRCWGGPWYIETSDIGMKINSNANVLGPIYSHSCMFGNVQVLGSYSTIRDFEITTNASLSEGSGEAQSGSEGTITLKGASTYATNGLIGLRVAITGDTGAGQSRTITSYNGSSDVAVVTPGWNTPPAAGSDYVILQAPAIDVTAQENTIINGRIGTGAPVLDGVTAIRIKGINSGMRQTIRDVLIFGTTNSSAPLISVEQTLEDSTVVAKCFHAGTFVDLYPLVAKGTSQGTVSGSETTTIKLATTEGFQDNYLNGMTITITSGTGSGQTRTILDYDMLTNAATVPPAWTTAPVSGSKYEVKANGIGTGNYIQLSTAGDVTKKVNLPPTWDEANSITIDGLKLRGSITGVTAATQAVITSPAHGLANGDKIAIDGVRGQTAVNSAAGQVHAVSNITTDTFTIQVNTSMGSAYESGSGWWGNWEAK